MQEALGVAHRFLIDTSVPEGDAHVRSLRLSVGKDDGLTEVRPHVLGLNVSEENVCIDSKYHSQSKSFPSNTGDTARGARDSEGSEMLSPGRVELDAAARLASVLVE